VGGLLVVLLPDESTHYAREGEWKTLCGEARESSASDDVVGPAWGPSCETCRLLARAL
jgi:hypothetical protein